MTSCWVRFAVTASLAFGLSGSAVGRTPEPSLWRFVHPDAKAMVGIQWSRVQESELGRWIQRRWIGGLAMPGSEFLKDVTEVLISSPGTLAGSDDEEAPLLVAIRGNFSLARVEEVLSRRGAKKQMFGRIALWRPQSPSSPDPVFALLSPQTILAGDLQSLFSTIERSEMDISVRSSEPILERAHVLACKYDCWAVMRGNGAMHNFLLSSLAGKTLSPDSQGFEAGITVRDGLALDVTLNVRTDRAARLLQGDLKRLVHTAALEKAGVGGFAALLDQLQITNAGPNVLLSLRVSGGDAARALNPVQIPTNRTTDAVQITPPPNLTIKIEGLDDGPREIPFKP